MIIHQYDGEFFLLFFYLTFGFSMKFSKFRQSRICNLLFFYISTLICNCCSVLLTYIVVTIQIEGVSDTDIYNHFYLIKLLVVLMWQIICILSLMHVSVFQIGGISDMIHLVTFNHFYFIKLLLVLMCQSIFIVSGVCDSDSDWRYPTQKNLVAFNHFYFIKLLLVLIVSGVCFSVSDWRCNRHNTFGYIQSILFYQIITSFDVSEHQYRIWCLYQCFRLKVYPPW